MNYRDFFLLESWKNYVVSTNPEILLYDFYVLSYLTTLPIDATNKRYAGSFVGREASEIKSDIDNAEDKLLPVLRDKLTEALFIAICAEIRHVLDKRQDWSNYKNNKLLTQYIRNYQLISGNTPPEFQPKRNVGTTQLVPKEKSYMDSFKAVTKAIKDTGSSREQFVQMTVPMFRTMKWSGMFGGEKWAQISEGYLLLIKHPQTKQQLQVAIDHAYDLQHNTNTVLNKVSDYYIKNDITWLKKALDFKADLKSLYQLLPKCSSDMRKLALEAFKAAGVNKDTLEKTIPSISSKTDKQIDEKPKTVADAIGKTGIVFSKNERLTVQVVGVQGTNRVVVAHRGSILDRTYTLDDIEWKNDEKTSTSSDSSSHYDIGTVIQYPGYVYEVYKIFSDHVHLKVVSSSVNNIKVGSVTELTKRNFEKDIKNKQKLSLSDFKYGQKFKLDGELVTVTGIDAFNKKVSVKLDGPDELLGNSFTLPYLLDKVEFVSSPSDDMPKADFGADLEPDVDDADRKHNIGKYVEFYDSPVIGGEEKLIFVARIIGYDSSNNQFTLKIIKTTPANATYYEYTEDEIIRWNDDGSLKIVDGNKYVDIDIKSPFVNAILNKHVVKLNAINTKTNFALAILQITSHNLNFRDVKRRVKSLDNELYFKWIKESTAKIITTDIATAIITGLGEVDKDETQIPEVDKFLKAFKSFDDTTWLFTQKDKSTNTLKSLFALRSDLEKYYNSPDFERVIKKIYGDFNTSYHDSFKDLFSLVKPYPIDFPRFEPLMELFNIKGNKI